MRLQRVRSCEGFAALVVGSVAFVGLLAGVDSKMKRVLRQNCGGSSGRLTSNEFLSDAMQ